MLDVLDPDQVVLRSLLERAAVSAANEIGVVFDDGTTWTWLQALQQASAAAHQLRAMGVTQDSVVAVAVPNGASYLRAWWGAALLGASTIPVNVAFRGEQIAHLLRLGRPGVVVSSPEFRAHLKNAPPGVRIAEPVELISANTTLPALDRPIAPWDAALLGLTSGSTGMSKLVRVSHAHSRAAAEPNFAMFGINSEDVYLADIALVHVSALYFVHAAVAHRTRIVMRARPALDRYWEVARETGATVSQLYSTMITYLDGRPPRDTDRAHRLRVVVTVPLPPEPARFANRFGIGHLAIGYGSTELACPIAHDPTDPLPARSTGRPLPGWDLRLVDENDIEVAAGDPGELIVRSTTPWVIATEYVNDPVATVRAWRNGWFHTGDVMRRSETGDYYFVDRLQDAIRRRGENICSADVEAALRSFPGVADVAVVRAQSVEGVEDEVKAWVRSQPGVELDFASLLEHCAARLAHYMVPRYFQLIDDFPRTASMKIRKNVLRDRGNTDETWDRLAHGINVTRHGVVHSHAAPMPPTKLM